MASMAKCTLDFQASGTCLSARPPDAPTAATRNARSSKRWRGTYLGHATAQIANEVRLQTQHRHMEEGESRCFCEQLNARQASRARRHLTIAPRI